ncbi:MAG: transglutaminase family protein [Candidatus Hydrogenedentes bacterium]|nr:transglutaminase family protein [Candidatus Hydrogenedentota bacterium]
MKYRVVHTTRYDYSEPVPICYNVARLTPRACAYQGVLSTRIDVEPVKPVHGRMRRDYFGNELTYFTIQDPHRWLTITVDSEVVLSPPSHPGSAETAAWEEVPEVLRSGYDEDTLSAYQFVFDSRFVKATSELADYAKVSFPKGRPALDAVLDLTERIHRDFKYDPTATTIATPLEEVMQQRRGVCQDFAHLEIGCLRAMGLAARYVSGYIFGGERVEGAPLTGAWASHAWVSVYVPGHGWVDTDPTNNTLAGLDHITLAWGRDYEDVSPIRGVVLGGGQHSLSVSVDITRQT